jgi:hypothetical protein
VSILNVGGGESDSCAGGQSRQMWGGGSQNADLMLTQICRTFNSCYRSFIVNIQLVGDFLAIFMLRCPVELQPNFGAL